MKPVKVIPSGKRRKTPNQLLGQIQSNLYMPQIQQTQALSQLQTLRQSNSQLSLHPLSLIKSKADSNLISQHTTVQQSIVLPPQHYVRVLSNNQIIKTNDELLSKKSLSSLNQQPSIGKLSMIPLRQQLYMDERNPFLDEGTKVMKSSSKLKLGTPNILNISDNNIHLSKQHDAPSHLYQLQPLNTSSQRHKRNSSSLEYGNGQLIPNSVKSVQQINFGLLPPTQDNQRQLQELIENRGPLMNSAPMGITESSRHKSRINLLEKARKILEEQSGKQNNQVSSFEAKISTATNSSRKKRQSTNDQ
ncbi:hypothetical protein FGO68_gene14968 [Halteria grandinella]|uniref:Uncharacterized protein n=1 Tax=Halteria grandinella TaxID=5974 RepID=A0A8J8NFT4_HALGN|nr:hypothetical protein FGO68_gene14968 [Halteria grandinella]